MVQHAGFGFFSMTFDKYDKYDRQEARPRGEDEKGQEQRPGLTGHQPLHRAWNPLRTSRHHAALAPIGRRTALLAWRAADTLLALTMLVYFMPLIVLVGVLVWFNGGGPIFIFIADARRPGAPLLRRFRLAPARLPLSPPMDGIAPARRPSVTAAGGMVARMHADRLPGLFDVLAGRAGLLNPHLPGIFR